MNASPLLEIRNGTLGYGRQKVLDKVDFTVSAGDYVGVVGPNGSGKTTLLLSLLGARPLLAGSLERARELEVVGFVPQRHDPNHYVPLDAGTVVEMGTYGRLRLGRRLPERTKADVEEALSEVGLADKAKIPFRDLSGGQQQRVLIARALAGGSPLLLLDEPTEGMDLPSQVEIMDLLDRLHDNGRTIIVVSHELGRVASRASTIALIYGGGLHWGPREKMLTPETLSRAYGCPVTVEDFRGETMVRLSSAERSL